MNDATRQSMEQEIEIRNKRIKQLQKEVSDIYEAARHLIKFAQDGGYDGSKALWLWDDERPAPTFDKSLNEVKDDIR